MKTILSAALFAISATSLGACASYEISAIRTITDSPVGQGSTKEIVGNAVRTSFKSRLWTIEDETEDSVTASIQSDSGSMAKVKVTYDADSFSIERLDTDRFDYDAKAGTISTRYNRWITNIEHDVMIRTGISPEDANAHVYRARAATKAETVKK